MFCGVLQFERLGNSCINLLSTEKVVLDVSRVRFWGTQMLNCGGKYNTCLNQGGGTYSNSKVTKMANFIKKNSYDTSVLPPVKLYKLNEDCYAVLDGHHTYRAIMKLYKENISNPEIACLLSQITCCIYTAQNPEESNALHQEMIEFVNTAASANNEYFLARGKPSAMVPQYTATHIEQ